MRSPALAAAALPALAVAGALAGLASGCVRAGEPRIVGEPVMRIYDVMDLVAEYSEDPEGSTAPPIADLVKKLKLDGDGDEVEYERKGLADAEIELLEKYDIGVEAAPTPRPKPKPKAKAKVKGRKKRR